MRSIYTKRFSTKPHLEAHIKSVHENIFEYGCDQQYGEKLVSKENIEGRIRQIKKFVELFVLPKGQ